MLELLCVLIGIGLGAGGMAWLDRRSRGSPPPVSVLAPLRPSPPQPVPHVHCCRIRTLVFRDGREVVYHEGCPGTHPSAVVLVPLSQLTDAGLRVVKDTAHWTEN